MTAVPQPTRADESASHSRWVARTWLSRILRVGIWLVPVILSLALIVVAARVWPPQELGISLVAWWVIFGSVAMAVLMFTDRIARRFLPLSALLRMALVFPDQAPSRFGAALRYGTAKKLLNRNPPTSQALMSLVQAISHHDRATRGHSERVRAYSQLIGQELKLDAQDMDRLSWAALLHDVGKLDVSAEILNKKGRPNDDEWNELRKHPSKAEGYLEGYEHWIGDWGRAASEHHERWDGKGYPNGLAGEQIHQAGRIVAVADAYDVMTSVRSYKKSMPTPIAREEIARNAGSQFDPAAVRGFLNVGIGQVNTKWGAFSWMTQIPEMVSRAPAAGLLLAVILGASMGLIDPSKETTEPRVVVEQAGEAVDAPTAPSAPSAPTATPTPTPTATPAAANDGDDGAPGAGATDGGSGSGGSDGADDEAAGGASASVGDEAGGGDDKSSAADDAEADQTETAVGPEGQTITPTAVASRSTVGSGAAAPAGAGSPSPLGIPTPGAAPTPTTNPVFDLLGGTPTPTPTIDPTAALYGPTLGPVPDPLPGNPRPAAPTATSVPSPTATALPTPTTTPTPTPVPIPTPTPTSTPIPTPTSTATPTPTATPIPTPTSTPTPTATPIPTSTATPTPTPVPVVLAFRDANYSGLQIDFPVGTFGAAELGALDNEISSLILSPGVTVVACDEPVMLNCEVYTNDIWFVGPAMNDSISYLTITLNP